jgi:hypothetical protein
MRAACTSQRVRRTGGNPLEAIDFAYSTIEEAEDAVLNAVLARADADAAAGAKLARAIEGR